MVRLIVALLVVTAIVVIVAEFPTMARLIAGVFVVAGVVQS